MILECASLLKYIHILNIKDDYYLKFITSHHFFVLMYEHHTDQTIKKNRNKKADINWRLVDHRKKFINPLNSYKLNTSTQKNITIHLLSFHIICIYTLYMFSLHRVIFMYGSLLNFMLTIFFLLGISHRPMSCSLFHSICFSILLFLFFLFIISFVHKSDWTWFDEVVLYTQVHCQISMYHI